MNHGPEIDRHAYNAAFYELGLRWCWDEDTWRDLTAIGCEESRIKTYVEKHQPHLLKAYDADFLAGVIRQVKDRCYSNIVGAGMAKPIDWTAFQHAEVGV